MATHADSQLRRTDEEEAEAMDSIIHELCQSDPSTRKQAALEKILDDQKLDTTQQAKIHDNSDRSMDSATSPLLSTSTAMDTKTIPAAAASGFGIPSDLEVAPGTAAPVVISTTAVEEMPADDGLVVVQEQVAFLAPEDDLLPGRNDSDHQQLADYIAANDDDLAGAVIRALETAGVDVFAEGPGGLLEEELWASEVIEILPLEAEAAPAFKEGNATYHQTREEMEASPH